MAESVNMHVCLTSPAPVCLHVRQHLVDPVGIAASLPAVLPQLTDIRQRVQGTAEISLPCLWVWLVFARTVPP